ncbi:MAG: hypothetical protein FJZ01_12700 [Candidatus Sericytochromatia bacterium]|nr:hypothetical protein [Candidatus Tanganyikabacteria bacterium]
MRLPKVERGDSPGSRLLFGLIRLLSGHRAPDVIRTMKYRPTFLGGPMAELTQAVMRGPSAWSVGERELMAAFVSSLNRCRF